jgi:hypothetical protein
MMPKKSPTDEDYRPGGRGAERPGHHLNVRKAESTESLRTGLVSTGVL